jgi:hypothetical protein
MKSTIIVLILFSIVSCKSVQEPICKSSLGSKYFFDNVALKPIEILPHKNVLRVWIDNSSSLTDVLTIVWDDSGNYAEFVRMGLVLRKRIIGKEMVGKYEQIETCPLQGWDNFFNSLDLLNLSKMENRIFNEEVDPSPMAQPQTIYFIEIKMNGVQKKFEFYTFYPSQSFADDMMDYKNFEKFILTSFPPLFEKLNDDQQFYKYRLKNEY